MFLVEVMTKYDCRSHYWKENFILGFSILLTKKVKQRIGNLHGERIPYELLTYEELITFINNKELALCIDFKLKSQMKKERQDNKKIMKILFILWIRYFGSPFK